MKGAATKPAGRHADAPEGGGPGQDTKSFDIYQMKYENKGNSNQNMGLRCLKILAPVAISE